MTMVRFNVVVVVVVVVVVNCRGLCIAAQLPSSLACQSSALSICQVVAKRACNVGGRRNWESCTVWVGRCFNCVWGCFVLDRFVAFVVVRNVMSIKIIVVVIVAVERGGSTTGAEGPVSTLQDGGCVDLSV